MKATGIVRRIDDLGRVVIPKEIRRTLRIRDGDPLEIYTEKDGEVIFKKYSPMGGLSEYAAEICDSMSKTSNCPAAITDRDSVISVCGAPRRELAEKRISGELEQLMECRQLYRRKPAERAVPVIDGETGYSISVACPIICEGDVMGCVVFLGSDGANPPGDAECKLATMASKYLGKQMES
jgi:AbrB family transcriptional regulator (stage V sporulation protein T)